MPGNARIHGRRSSILHCVAHAQGGNMTSPGALGPGEGTASLSRPPRLLNALQAHGSLPLAGRLPLELVELGAAVVRFHDHVTGSERLTQDVDALLRLGVSAHEDVERSVIGFRPAMDGDVTL